MSTVDPSLSSHPPGTDKWPLNVGAGPGFFLGGGALVSCSISTPINHLVSFFFRRIPVVLENPRSSRGGGGAHPLHPPPRSAPVMEAGHSIEVCPKLASQHNL